MKRSIAIVYAQIKVFKAACSLFIAFCLLSFSSSGQTTNQKLQAAFQTFESDPQLKHAISSLYVIDAATGQVVFDKNSQVGLAGASTQKIITASTAFELLGKGYQYKTAFGYDGEIKDGTLNGNLYVIGTGDPTLGSWRYASTKEEKILAEMTESFLAKGMKGLNGDIFTEAPNWDSQAIPGGWIWQDIGNYYGAGARGLNWRENQYDLILQSGNRIGDPVRIAKTIPSLYRMEFVSEVKSAAKNTGDNAYIYLPLEDSYWDEYAKRPISGHVRGTIPIGENSFAISGAMTSPQDELGASLQIALSVKIKGFSPYYYHEYRFKEGPLSEIKNLYVHYSPSLDSIIYWFLKKSINLYGEALVKTFAFEKKGFGSTDSGVAIVKDFWKQKGIDEDELNIYDGSGLSPQNRITTHAQVEVLKYAKTREWFPYFYDALPEFNGMKMKSGTISDVKGFCGYQKASDGKEYIFSFLVNNYNGRTSGVVEKMYKVLDILK